MFISYILLLITLCLSSISQIENLTMDHSHRSFSILQKLIDTNKYEDHWLERKNAAQDFDKSEVIIFFCHLLYHHKIIRFKTNYCLIK